MTARSLMIAVSAVALTRLSDIKQVAASKSERTCTAQAEITGGVLNLDYRLDWSGWSAVSYYALDSGNDFCPKPGRRRESRVS